MARIKKILRRLGGRDSALCEERCTETFTHKCVLADGTVIRGDPANNFWGDQFGSYYGLRPKAWDDASAVAEEYWNSYVCEADYS